MPVNSIVALIAIFTPVEFFAFAAPLYAQVPVSDATTSGAEYAPATLTLGEALALARQNNWQVRIAGLQVGAAQQQTAAARTALLPQISLQALAGRLVTPVKVRFPGGIFGTVNGSPVPASGMDVRTDSRFTQAYSIGIAQPITQLPRIRTGIRLQEVGTEMAREQERGQRQTSAAQVRQVYHAILLTQETIAAGNEQLKALQQIERTVAENMSRETALRADLLEVQARRTAQEATLSATEDTLQQYREQLNLLLGRDTRTPFDVAPVADDTPPDTDENGLTERALRNRPELRVNALQVRRAELDRRMTEQDRTPALSLATNYTVPQNGVNGLPDRIWTVGVQLSWDGLDWGRRNRESAAKGQAIKQAQLALDETRSQVQIDVRNQLRRWRQARAAATAARAGQEAATERLRVITNQFQAQTALLKDVLQAQATLADANRQVQETALASLTAQSELRRAIGEE